MIDLLLEISITIGIITWALVARWYLVPWMHGQMTLTAALTPLLLVNALPYVGLAFFDSGRHG